MTEIPITVSDMVERLKVTRERVENAIAKLGIEPVTRYGNVRAYRPEVTAQVRDQILRTSPPPQEIDDGPERTD